MAEEKKPTSTDYRARPLPEGQTTVEKLNALQPEQRVVVEAQVWYKSHTVIINGLLLIASTVLQVGDVIFGANLLEPLVGIFTKDPEVASKSILAITQLYSILGLFLRARTNAPITLRTDKKE